MFKVEVFRSDFEKSSYGAMTRIFPNIRIELCFFHLSQANWRKIQELGLSALYKKDSDFALKMRMVTALAFVHKCDIPTAFEELKTEMPAEAEPYLDYFETTYVGRYHMRKRRRCGRPLFDINKWCVHERTIDNEPRTTNFLEGWHRRVQSIAVKDHPNLWEFLKMLKGEQSRTQMLINAASSGEDVARRRKKKEARDQRIRKMVTEYEERTSEGFKEYLSGMATNVAFY
jgi:hypothetical protein